MLVTILFRRGSSVQWASANPILASGEPGYDETIHVFKIGDGINHWSTLDAVSADDEAIAALALDPTSDLYEAIATNFVHAVITGDPDDPDVTLYQDGVEL